MEGAQAVAVESVGGSHSSVSSAAAIAASAMITGVADTASGTFVVAMCSFGASRESSGGAPRDFHAAPPGRQRERDIASLEIDLRHSLSELGKENVFENRSVGTQSSHWDFHQVM